MTIDFYYLPVSPPCRAVMMLAKAIGVHLNYKIIDVTKGEQLSDDYKKLNPQHTIPTIDDNGLILSESRAIMGYLVNKYAKNDSLYPTDPKKKGIVDDRLYFDLCTLWPRIAKTYFPVVFKMTNAINEEDVKSMERGFEILNALLSNGEFAAEENLTIADFSMVMSVGMAQIFGFDISPYENVVSWFERCQEALEKYGYEEINAPAQALGEWFRANLEVV
ncbi:glutathione S-transferase 1-like [Chelonus insularis]|uniref:glutathione S-transferase 1-like n=1 Tax=Chelonus insularis TaxID=460826 RepID=UPI00158E9A0F|nr:glutathione S-transferase 1-like [Chelonus insularis]